MDKRDYVTLGPAPADEACAQVGDDFYAEKARAECRRFITLLRETFGPEPSGAYLTTKGFPHDYGTYYGVVCYFNERAPQSVDYAFRCEREAPTTWRREAADDTSVSCPECGEMLEKGNGFSLSAMVTGEVYLCRHCRILFTHDLAFLATYVG
jgi:hypothetical protein